MRSVFVSLLMLLGLCNVGCQVAGRPTTNPVEAFEQSIFAHSTQIQATATVGTRLGLLSVAPKDRAKATAEVHKIAVAVQSALREANPTVTDIKTLALSVVGNSDSEYVEVVATLIDSGSALVDAQLQEFYANASADQHTKAALQLMRSVVDGIVAGSARLVSVPRPTTQPSAQNFVVMPKRMVVDSPFDRKVGV